MGVLVSVTKDDKVVKACSPPPIELVNVFPQYDFAYIGIPKCGTQTMKKAFWPDVDNYPCYGIDASLQVGTRITVIRHPLDRVFSAWNHIWPSYSFERWWEHVRANPKWDIHTYPYSDYLAEYPTEIYTLENWDQWWPKMVKRYPELFPETMPWRNYSERNFDLDQYREYHDDILNIYEGDLALFDRVHPCGSLKEGQG